MGHTRCESKDFDSAFESKEERYESCRRPVVVKNSISLLASRDVSHGRRIRPCLASSRDVRCCYRNSEGSSAEDLEELHLDWTVNLGLAMDTSSDTSNNLSL